jgi:hypothetical protein
LSLHDAKEMIGPQPLTREMTMLIEIAIVGGALITGIKTYRQYRCKREVNRFLIAEHTGSGRPEDTPFASAVEEVKDIFYDFTQNTVVPIVETVHEKIRSRSGV